MSEIRTSVTLHRGADTIGGSCIRVSHGKDSIILDYGMPLMAAGGHELDAGATKAPSLENQILLDVISGENRPLAFIISHAHPDHYGLIDYVPEDIPVFISEAAKVLMEVGNAFYDGAMRVARLDGCMTYRPGKVFEVGPFRITAFLMDHSAFGACSLLVEVDGKTVFYTGDFRGHGRKSATLDYVINAVREPDVMLMEGTTLDDGHPSTFPDEGSIEQALVDLMTSQEAPVFVAGSGSNIDRTVSLYRAARRSGRELVIDLYQMILLDKLKALSPGLPPHANDHLKVYYPKNQRDTVVRQWGEGYLLRYAPRHINRSKVDFSSGKYLFRVSNGVTKSLCRGFMEAGVKPELVYSMWNGYREKQDAFSRIEELAGAKWQYLHTSGHAYLHTLKRLADGVAPKRLVPVHTLNAADFDRHFENTHQMSNGDELVL